MCRRGIVSLLISMQKDVRNSDRPFVIGSIAQTHQVGCERTWVFIKKNWKKFCEMYKGTSLLVRLVQVRFYLRIALFKILYNRKNNRTYYVLLILMII